MSQPDGAGQHRNAGGEWTGSTGQQVARGVSGAGTDATFKGKFVEVPETRQLAVYLDEVNQLTIEFPTSTLRESFNQLAKERSEAALAQVEQLVKKL
eukprot:366390-Chlamydomonas_euryale.AAC.21